LIDRFGKPAGDIAIESGARSDADTAILEVQRQAQEILAAAQPRAECLLCGVTLEGATLFDHRHVNYVRCTVCGQVQTQACPPTGYPEEFSGTALFENVYPRLPADAYISRRDRIYKPKLEWILDVLRSEGWSEARLKAANWTELGAGAGYFLHALTDFGASSIAGVEASPSLVELANAMLDRSVVRHHETDLSDAVHTTDSEIYVAFFVVEHIDPAQEFWRAMADKPSGTVFAFAVPCMGISTLMETASGEHAARNLDSVLHTQLYTDRSIAYALDSAGYAMKGRWTFGQDADDLVRLLISRLSMRMEATMISEISARLAELIDPLQEVIDRGMMSDARHVLAVKT